MVIKVYTSGISGNKEVKKRQQRIMMILESKGIEYEAIDITEPGNEDDKQFMQDHAKPKDGAKHPLPPQIFNELEYCGDYDGFDVANENDELEVFLKMPIPPKPIVPVVNGSAPEPEEESTLGFCYTPSLAKRLEKALKNRLRQKRPTVRGYCYTPSLAQRLAKAMERTLVKKNVPEVEYQVCCVPIPVM
uniref:SH3 domain-binding glutamic acid-rich n=1 Tax=Lygus hesperus TaxID=30085 RepID=A0A0A9W193_LYGHE